MNKSAIIVEVDIVLSIIIRISDRLEGYEIWDL